MLKTVSASSIRPHFRRNPVLKAIFFFARNSNKLPFITIHLLVIAAFFVPITWTSVAIAGSLYVLRMFAITAGYHRYFSHRSYKTSRVFQFILGWLGCMSMQKGPLWWAANHRNHHKYSDMEEDPHSPVRHSLFWSHMGWVLAETEVEETLENIPDFTRYPELRLLDTLHWIPPLSLLAICVAIDGISGFFWGFVVGTVLLYHGTFLVNSICHVWGTRRFKTTDDSRNNLFAAILTLGEGWHNNHHHYMSSANQGFRWWEIDMSYYALRTLAVFGIVWDLRKPPPEKMIPHTHPEYCPLPANEVPRAPLEAAASPTQVV